MTKENRAIVENCARILEQNSLGEDADELRDVLKEDRIESQLDIIIPDLQNRVKNLIRALNKICKIEQEHCYFEPHDSEVNDRIQTNYDLRKCGDIARDALRGI